MIPEIKDKKIKSVYILLEKVARQRGYRSIGLICAHGLIKRDLGISERASPEITIHKP